MRKFDDVPVEVEREDLPASAYGTLVMPFQTGMEAAEEFWRQEWGAMPPKGNPGGYQSLDATVLHYTAAGHGYLVQPHESHSECIAQVQSIQRQHQNDPSQTDISYSTLACSHGYLIEGRVLGYKGGANGTADSNARMPSCCALVGVDDVPPEPMLRAIQSFHARVEARAGRRLDMLPHSAITSTSCPGDWLHGWIERDGYHDPDQEDPMANFVPDVVQITEPYGDLPAGAVLLCDPFGMTHRWVKDEGELEQLRATFARRGWVFPSPIPPIPVVWMKQYGVRIG